MNTFQGGYYIDELNAKLREFTEQETINQFYENNIYFNIYNLSQYINFNEINPLLKVSWNILTRGNATRASLKISDYLLNRYFKEQHTPIVFSKPYLQYDLNLEVDKNEIQTILKEFSSINEAFASEYGSQIFKVYQCLKKLIIYAQVQRCLLLQLMSDPSKPYFVIKGLEPEESELLIQDLNNLFTGLNTIASDKEEKLPLIQLSKKGETININNGNTSTNEIGIISFVEPTNNTFNKVLTDRRIKYNPLGQLLEEEKDGEYYQRFEYNNKKQYQSFKYLLNNLFRIADFWPGQEEIINRALTGEDVIGLLPTGGGKSLTFQLCALLHPGVTIVVDPINSLMKDQYDKLLANGISNTDYINSFKNKEEKQESLDKLADSQFQILFVSPERFQIEKFRTALLNCKNEQVYFSYAVIDEAHCVSEWGHDFRHVYLDLAQNMRRFCLTKSDKLTLFGLTATASFDVLADVQRELELKEDSIVSLPAEAIDRKELNFNILAINNELNNNEVFWEREKELGHPKYKKIKNFLDQLPSKMNNIEKKHGYLLSQNDFYNKYNGQYKNAGVIYCPTKSDRLPNGVLSLKRELEDLDYLEITTFFGNADDSTIKDKFIEEQANLSIKNQTAFLNNKSNLMIATKAFGMGIDKPNIRYTIHYSFPSSVESFYQEAGRAGRDRKPSICVIVYHPDDIYTNYDFYRNSFKGITREREIIDELLDEVQYEDGFFTNVISKIVKETYPIVGKISLWNNRYLNIFGPYHENVRIGKIDLNYSDLRNYDNWRQNIDKEQADDILDFIRQTLKKESENDNIKVWLNKKSSDGIKSLIENDDSRVYALKVGFTNGVISELNEAIINNGYEDFKEVIIRAAYNFCSDENDFIDNLRYQYYRFQMNNYNEERKKFNPDNELIKLLKENYFRIRNSADTQKAIYRMSIVGIIDDYVIDYVGGFIEIRFHAKSEEEYKSNFKEYLRRYLGVETTTKWLDKINEINDDSMLRKVLYVLIDFIEREISHKRKRSIDYMNELCKIYLDQGEREFRDRMIRYFTSKYARSDYLPQDTENGRKENCAIVKQYIEYIFDPPDGLGGQIDNAKHLRGACDNLRINMVENASIDLLTSFSLLALELKETDSINDAQNKPLVNQAINLYRSGFRRMLKIDSWEEVKNLIELFNHKVLDFNSNIKPLMNTLSSELMVNRTSYKLKEFLNKMT
jgi:ATP-dependent DNA helicase RecQ